MNTINLPVKNYVRHTHELISDGISSILAFFGIKTTEWKILHSIYVNARICKAELALLMDPFADAATVNNILVKLKIMHVIFDAEEKITLTSNGLDIYTKCLQQQQEFMQRVAVIPHEDNIIHENVFSI